MKKRLFVLPLALAMLTCCDVRPYVEESEESVFYTNFLYVYAIIPGGFDMFENHYFIIEDYYDLDKEYTATEKELVSKVIKAGDEDYYTDKTLQYDVHNLFYIADIEHPHYDIYSTNEYHIDLALIGHDQHENRQLYVTVEFFEKVIGFTPDLTPR